MVGKIIQAGTGDIYVDEQGRRLSAGEILRMAEELESLRDVVDAAKQFIAVIAAHEKRFTV